MKLKTHWPLRVLIVASVSVAVVMTDFSGKKLAPPEKGTFAQMRSFMKLAQKGHFINQANASTTLQVASTVRFMYWLINGPPAAGYPAGMGGPEGGFLGMIREINGPTALGGGLASCGYTTCAAIPTSGTPCPMTDAEGTFTMTFGTPSQAVPSGYGEGDNAGLYDRRVSVNFSDGTNDVDFMIAEFNCSNTSGWMRFHQPTDDLGAAYTAGTRTQARNMEVYYDATSASATKLELYMSKVPAAPSAQDEDEKFAAKFSTETEGKYRIWITRYAFDGTSSQGFKAAVYGDTTNDLANVFMEYDATPDANTTTAVTADTGDISGGDIDCVDFNDGGTPVDASGSCGSLSLTDAGTPIAGGSDGFSMEWTKDVMSGLMTSY